MFVMFAGEGDISLASLWKCDFQLCFHDKLSSQRTFQMPKDLDVMGFDLCQFFITYSILNF